MTSGTPTERLLAATVDLASRAGYHGVGINQVLEQADVGNGSLYHAFPDGKAQLVAAAVAGEAQRMADALDAILGRGSAEVIRTMFAAAERELVRTDFAHGCRVTTAVADGADVEAVRTAGADAFTRWTQLIARQLRAEGAGRSAAASTADAMVSLYIGAWVACRAKRSTTPMVAARQAALALAHVAVGGAPR